MKSFLHRLWNSPLKGILIALPPLLLGLGVNHLAGTKGVVSLPAQTVVDILLLWGGSLFAVCGVAYSYWKKCQPCEKIEAARKAGRPICHCTIDGSIMLLAPNQTDPYYKFYVCSLCKDRLPVQVSRGISAIVG